MLPDESCNICIPSLGTLFYIDTLFNRYFSCGAEPCTLVVCMRLYPPATALLDNGPSLRLDRDVRHWNYIPHSRNDQVAAFVDMISVATDITLQWTVLHGAQLDYLNHLVF